MRHRARRVVGIESEAVTVAAMVVHRHGQHAGTARFRFVAFAAGDDTIALGRHDAVGLEVGHVVELQIGAFVTDGIGERQVFDLPVEAAIVQFNRHVKADLECRMIVQEVSGALQLTALRQVRVTVGA